MSGDSPQNKKPSFFTKLRSKKARSRAPSVNQSLASASATPTASIKSPNLNRLQKLQTRSSGRSRRELSEERRLVGDNDSFLYNDDSDLSDAEFDSDSSLRGSLYRSATAQSNRKSRPRAGTFDHHPSNEKVFFPEAEKHILNSDMLTLNLQDDQEPPWAGMTYESFLTPKYMKLYKRNKQSPKVIDNLFLAQELNVGNSTGEESQESDKEIENGAYEEDSSGFEQASDIGMSKEIFVMKFSRDGKYLAAAGRDAVIRIWKVIASPLGRLEYKQHEREAGSPERSSRRDYVYDSAPVFHRTPIELRGHKRSILTLAWSKNNFLISGSMDKTAKLWHVDRPNCLQTFKHEDFVTAVEFHPLDDRFFVSGSLDNEVRLWSVLENSVSYWRNLGKDVLITAANFTPDGLYCIAGGFNGSLFILETKGLHVVNRVEIRERSIVHPFHEKSGNKITGIEVFENTAYQPSSKSSTSSTSSAKDKLDPALDKWTVLITTNDSRVRIISTQKKKLITRFRGLVNNSSSIAANIRDDHKYVISGSEDHYCYIWENNNSIINNKLRQSMKEFVLDGKQHINEFHHKHEKYTKLLQTHKIFNKLFDSEDDSQYDFVANENNSYSSFHAHHSKCNVAIIAPQITKTLLALSDDLIYDLKKRGEACRMDPSKCYCSTSSKEHRHDDLIVSGSGSNAAAAGDGDIIVTTDQYGLIRVFRQDCAASYRKQFIEFYKKCQSHGPQIDNTNPLSPSNTIRSNTRSIRRGLGGYNGDRQSPIRSETRNIKNRLSSCIIPSSSSNNVAINSNGIGNGLVGATNYHGIGGMGSPHSSTFDSMTSDSTLANTSNYTYGSSKASNIFDHPIINVHVEDDTEMEHEHLPSLSLQQQEQEQEQQQQQKQHYQKGNGLYANGGNPSEATLNVIPNEHARRVDSRQETFPRMLLQSQQSVPTIQRPIPPIHVNGNVVLPGLPGPLAQSTLKDQSNVPVAPIVPDNNGSHSKLADVPIQPSH